MTKDEIIEAAFLEGIAAGLPTREIVEIANRDLAANGLRIVPDAVVTALLPFADALPRLDAKFERIKSLGIGDMSDNASTGLGIKFGHIRAAAAALAQLEGAGS
jgi:hypothetical protein